jgi:broad specificity phosphatase PhoE
MMIHLLRHAQFKTDDRGTHPKYYDPALNELGRRQAKALGKRFHEQCSVDVIYSSDLARAFQTAQIVAETMAVELRVDVRFREIYRGECEFRPIEELREEYPRFYDEWERRETDFQYPGGECGADVWKRASDAIQEIVEELSEGVGVVTHGGVIMALLSRYLGLDLADRFRFSVGLCSITSLEYDKASKRFTVVRVGDTTHLEGLC